MSRRRLKEGRKRLAGACALCRAPTPYAARDAHRRRAGGAYSWENTVCLCAVCHRRLHAGEVEILGRYLGTGGAHYLHVREAGAERFEREPSIMEGLADE